MKPEFKAQARIELLGKYTDGRLAPDGEGRKFHQMLGAARRPDGRLHRLLQGVIPVGKNAGGIRKIRVTVKDRAITLNELRIIYGSGQEDVIPVKAKIEAGSTYGPIELKGGTRCIKEVQARYRSRFIDKDARAEGVATVEI